VADTKHRLGTLRRSWANTQRGARSPARCLGYPAQLECTVDGERVRPPEGGFYGGWITDDVVGPFKGGPGGWGW